MDKSKFIRKNKFVRLFGFYFPSLYLSMGKLYRLLKSRKSNFVPLKSHNTFPGQKYKIRTKELSQFLRDFGIHKGDTLMVHSSWDTITVISMVQ